METFIASFFIIKLHFYAVKYINFLDISVFSTKNTVIQLFHVMTLQSIFVEQMDKMGRLEIKCPHCGLWTIWNGMLQDPCLQCGELLEQEKINKLQVAEKKRQLVAELEIVRLERQNSFLSKVFRYSSTVFIGFMLMIIAIIVLMAG